MENNQTNISTALVPIVPTLTALMSGHMYGEKEYLQEIVNQEIENLNYLALTNPAIQTCHPDTIKYAMRKVITQGLSFDPDAGLVYVTTRHIKKTDTTEAFTKLEATPTVNGEISLYRMAGTLQGIETPEVETDDNGYVTNVKATLIVPSGSGIRQMEFNFGKDFFFNLEKASHRQNSFGKEANKVNNTTLNWANPNYSNYYPDKAGAVHSYDAKGGIQPGFAITKAIKHALKRAKIDKNPYANRLSNINHLKVVDPQYASEDVVDDLGYVEVVTETPPEKQNVFKQKLEEDKKPETKAEVKQEVKAEEKPATSGFNEAEQKILDECKKATSRAGVVAVFNLNKTAVNANTALFAEVKKLSAEWKKKEEEAAAQGGVNASDL